MYLIEFEQAQNGDVTVRLIDPMMSRLLAEQTYHGNPPGLELRGPERFTLLRLEPVKEEKEIAQHVALIRRLIELFS